MATSYITQVERILIQAFTRTCIRTFTQITIVVLHTRTLLLFQVQLIFGVMDIMSFYVV